MVAEKPFRKVGVNTRPNDRVVDSSDLRSVEPPNSALHWPELLSAMVWTTYWSWVTPDRAHCSSVGASGSARLTPAQGSEPTNRPTADGENSSCTDGARVARW